jgi:hypothetical protein
MSEEKEENTAMKEKDNTVRKLQGVQYSTS